MLPALLLEAGWNPNAKDLHGNGPLWVAVFNAREDGSVVALLREHGADPYLLNNAGRSPLGLARAIANYDVASYFDDLPVI